MTTLKKTTLAAMVGAAALVTASAANATIMVGGDNGFEFSIDGNINQFFVASNSKNGGSDNTRVRNGLLPTYFGFNVKAPEVNGLTVAARVSISPSTNGGSYTNGNADGTGNQDGNSMEQREAYATVTGGFGQFMLGKGLGLYSSHNILLDQTLYGVGATSGSDDGTTTLGRIGYGYDYANWRSQIRWTSPSFSGFKIALALVDPEQKGQLNVIGSSGVTSRDEPRYEGDLSYGGEFMGGSFLGWVSGMSQSVSTSGDDIDSNAWTVGANLVVSGFDFTAAYYDNTGVGDVGGLVHTSATDIKGEERDGNGYYAQLGYTFAGATKVSASYGESNIQATNAADTMDQTTTSSGTAQKRSLWTLGVYHDVTSNLKLVAEYSQQEEQYKLDSSNTSSDVFSVGGFISW